MIELFLPGNSYSGKETAFMYFYVHWKEQPKSGKPNSDLQSSELSALPHR